MYCLDLGQKVISIGEIEELAAKGNGFYYCDGTPVRIDLLAPDVALGNLEHMMVEYSTLKIIKQVGEGGFATVYLGKLKDNDIAVKQLDLEKNESMGELFAEFRHEVSECI